MKKVFEWSKIIIINIIQLAIIFLSGWGTGNLLRMINEHIHLSKIYEPIFRDHYILILIIFIVVYLLVSILLFIAFKFIEIKLISKPKKDSYQYMFILFLLAILLVNIRFLLYSNFTLSFLPITLIIVVINLVYEFKIKKKN